MNEVPEKFDTAVLGAGCFWCIEAVFLSLKGVESVESGYSGGDLKNPTYKDICTGTTGHAEVAKIVFNPNIISFKEILEVFWKTHDPTTLNKQGNDVGTQYRSVIFYLNEKQRKIASYYKGELEKSGAWEHSIVTEISELGIYYKAENYHQNYFQQNKNQSYCKYIIQPKLDKFKQVFQDKLKK
jgi:peptide-methionine (S)-S-oxide reductase